MARIRKPEKVPTRTEEKRQPEVVEKKPDVTKSDDLRAVRLTLPSVGKTYGGKSEVLVRPPEFDEVCFLAEMNGVNYEDSLSRLIAAVVLDCPVSPEDMTCGDRVHLYLWIRSQVDPSYTFPTVCSSCTNVDRDYPLQISDIPIKSLPDEYEHPKEIKLPVSGKVLQLRAETGKDKALQVDLVSKGFRELAARCACVVVSVDGRPTNPNLLVDTCKAITKLAPQDGLVISEFLRWVDHGPDFANVPVKCRKCETEYRTVLPFRPEFYFPTSAAFRSLRDAIHGSSVREECVSGD